MSKTDKILMLLEAGKGPLFIGNRVGVSALWVERVKKIRDKVRRYDRAQI